MQGLNDKIELYHYSSPILISDIDGNEKQHVIKITVTICWALECTPGATSRIYIYNLI